MYEVPSIMKGFYLIYFFLLRHVAVLVNGPPKPGLVGVVGARINVRSSYSQWGPLWPGFEPRFSRLQTQNLLTTA